MFNVVHLATTTISECGGLALPALLRTKTPVILLSKNFQRFRLNIKLNVKD